MPARKPSASASPRTPAAAGKPAPPQSSGKPEQSKTYGADESGRLDALAGLPKPTTEQLVTTAIELRRQIAVRSAELELIEGKIVALGAGKHSGFGDDLVTVVAAAEPGPGKVSYPAIAEEKLEQARALAGAAFSKLFDKATIFTPCKGFADVAPKLLPPRTGVELVVLCEVVGKPYAGRAAYVKYSEAK